MPGPLTCRVAQESQRLEEQHRWTGLPFTRLTRKMEEEREAEPMKRADGRTCGGGESGGEKPALQRENSAKKPNKVCEKTDGWRPLKSSLQKPSLTHEECPHISHSAWILDSLPPGKSLDFNATQPNKRQLRTPVCPRSPVAFTLMDQG